MKDEKVLFGKMGAFLPQARYFAGYLDRLMFSAYDSFIVDAVNSVVFIKVTYGVAFCL